MLYISGTSEILLDLHLFDFLSEDGCSIHRDLYGAYFKLYNTVSSLQQRTKMTF